MKTRIIFVIELFLFFISCTSNRDPATPVSVGPKVVQADGYVVPKQNIAEPKVILAGKPRIVRAGKPKVIPTNTNIHLAGKPKVVTAGVPRICTPGRDSFSLPKTVPAIENPFLAVMPEIVIAKDASTKDHNPQSFSSFGILQGLKNELIRDLIEDSSGNLWFATNGGGVSKYDGKSFTHFTDKEGLSSLFVKCILEDKNGNLWFGTWSGGVSKYDGKSFTHFTVKEGLLNNTVNSLIEDNSGNIWFGTDGGGVSKYEPAKDSQAARFIHFTVKEGLTNDFVSCMYKDKSGDIWIGTEDGVSKYNASSGAGKSFTHFTIKEGLCHNSVKCIQGDRKGNLWFGTSGGVSKFEPAKDGQSARFTRFTVKEGLSSNYITDILEDKNGNIWFGTFNEGLNKYDGVHFTHYSEKDGLNNNEVRRILEDRSGNLWFGIFGGVCKYGGNSFTHFTEKDGLRLNAVVSILEDKNKNLWFGMKDGGVCKYNASGNTRKNFTHFTTREGLIDNSVWTIIEDRNGNLWFGTYAGVSKYDGKSFTHFTEKDGLTNNDVKSILEDKRGNIWFGTNGGGGLCKYDGKNFTQYGPKEGLSINNVMSIEEDNRGNLWFSGYLGGVTKYTPSADWTGGKNLTDGAMFTHFTVKEGLIKNDVRIILEDKSGNLWFSTIGGGVSKYELPKPGRTASFTHYTEKEGLSNNVIGSMMEDKSGNLWFGASLGLNKLEKEKQITNTSESGLFKTYSYEDGFSGIGINAGNTICEANDGTIWIGAKYALTAFHPARETPDTIAPTIQLTGLALYNQKIDWQNLLSLSNGKDHNNTNLSKPRSYQKEIKDTSIILGNGIRVHNFHFDGISRWYGIPEHLSLAYNNNTLTFQYVGITMQSPKKVKYQYKLEGLDENWSVLTTSSEANYGPLPPNQYTFKVKAMNGEGYWSNELGYSFIIRPPWWSTWWFRILSSVFILGTIILILYVWFHYKFRQKLKVELIRQKIAADLHDELGSSLSSMAFSAELVKKKLNGPREDIEQLLNKLVSTSKETTSLISDTIWSLNPKNDSFDKLKEHMNNFAQEILSSKEIEYKFDSNIEGASPNLSLEQKRNIYLIYKEAINNIAKHSKASHVQILMETLPDKLIIEITDNGIGFDTTETPQGNGLNNFKSRSDKESCEVLYSSIIGKGTSVKITAHYNSLKTKKLRIG